MLTGNIKSTWHQESLPRKFSNGVVVSDLDSPIRIIARVAEWVDARNGGKVKAPTVVGYFEAVKTCPLSVKPDHAGFKSLPRASKEISHEANL